jgi:hypothetical protein
LSMSYYRFTIRIKSLQHLPVDTSGRVKHPRIELKPPSPLLNTRLAIHLRRGRIGDGRDGADRTVREASESISHAACPDWR